jgi:GNAT superfamily N-acetyltransferase
MPGTTAERLIWLVRQVLTVDVTRVYRLRLQNVRAPAPGGFSCRFAVVDAPELRQLCEHARHGLDEALPALLASGQVICFAATQGVDLLGYVWFAEKEVDPRHNTGGPPFKGIGLSLDRGVCYLFKALVVPRFRGQQLMSRMIHAAVETLLHRGFDEIVTTTDIDNQAFQKSVERIGFTMAGSAAEWVFFDRHIYCLPQLDHRIIMRRGG